MANNKLQAKLNNAPKADAAPKEQAPKVDPRNHETGADILLYNPRSGPLRITFMVPDYIDPETGIQHYFNRPLLLAPGLNIKKEGVLKLFESVEDSPYVQALEDGRIENVGPVSGWPKINKQAKRSYLYTEQPKTHGVYAKPGTGTLSVLQVLRELEKDTKILALIDTQIEAVEKLSGGKVKDRADARRRNRGKGHPARNRR